MNPLKRSKYFTTSDSESFRYLVGDNIGVPITDDHPGAFLSNRRNHLHEGIDFYGKEGEPVYAIKDGLVVDLIQFTGEDVGSPWWNDTYALVIASDTDEYILYGELEPDVATGMFVFEGDVIGHLIPVLSKDKGRPQTMLHLEQYSGWDGSPWLGHTELSKTIMSPIDQIQLAKTEGSALLVCGTFDENFGKRSGFIDKALKEYYDTVDVPVSLKVVNGGHIDTLRDLAGVETEGQTVLWWPDVSNEYEKMLGSLNAERLIISKNNRDLSYTKEELDGRRVSAGAEKLIEFYKLDNKILWRMHTTNNFHNFYNPHPATLIKEALE